LDMAGPADEFLDEHVGAAKGGERLALRLLEQSRKILFALHDPHAAAAASFGRLQNDWIAKLRRCGQPLLSARDRIAAAQNGDVCLLGDVAGKSLVAELLESLFARADKRDPRFNAGPGQLRILR